MSSLFNKLNSADSSRKDPQSNQSPSVSSSSTNIAVKLAVLLSLVLSAAALCGAVYVYQSLNAEARQRQALEATQVQFQEKASALEASTNDYRSQIENLSSDLKRFAEEKKAIETELQKSKAEISAFKNKINQLEEKSEAIKQAGEAVAQLPAAAPVVASASLSSGAFKKAQVMTVNRKFNFVVVNLGAKDNLKLGDPLQVRQVNGDAAKLKVEKLYETFSAATILQESSNSPIQEGDTVERVV